MPTTTTSNATVVRRTAAKVLATYDYLDESGAVVGQVLRYDPKSFKQRRPKVGGGWEWKEPERKVPFHLPQLLAAGPREWIFIVEGEEDVLALESIGCVATCNLGGSARDVRPLSPFFSGAMVAVIPDNDEPGAKHAAKWEMALRGEAKEILILPAFDLGPGADPRDFVRQGGTKEQLLEQLREFRKLRELLVSERGMGGYKILDDVEAFVRRFVIYPSEHARVAHVLWIMHTWMMDAWDSTPRLAFLSPEPASGKTRALEVTETLTPRPVQAVNVTPAYLFRKVDDESGRPTILYDEIDTIFGPKADGNEEIRALLNAGHRKGAVAGRCVVIEKNIVPQDFPAYCAVAMAGLGELPTTILSRSINIQMHRRMHLERVESFRLKKVTPQVTSLCQAISSWTSSVFHICEDAEPEFPDGVEDRDADVWEAPLAIADAAGGEWPRRAREAALALTREVHDNPPSLNIRLLKDIRTVFGSRDKMSLQHIIDSLGELEEAPWNELIRGKPMTSHQLGRRLRTYGLKTRALNVGGARTLRGFMREDMEDTWLRYLGPERLDAEQEGVYPFSKREIVEISAIPATESPNGIDPDPPPY